MQPRDNEEEASDTVQNPQQVLVGNASHDVSHGAEGGEGDGGIEANRAVHNDRVIIDASFEAEHPPTTTTDDAAPITSQLYDLAREERWDDVLNRCRFHPAEVAYVDVSNDGYTALHAACEGDPPTPVLACLLEAHLRYFRPAFPHGASSDFGTGYPYPTPLHVAVRAAPARFIPEGGRTRRCCASVEVVRALLEAFGPMSAASERYRRAVPLHVACLEGAASADVVRALIEALPDSVFFHDGDGNTPFMCAVQSSRRTFGETPTLDVLRALLEGCGNPRRLARMVNLRGVSPLSALWESLPVSEAKKLEDLGAGAADQLTARAGGGDRIGVFWSKIELILRAMTTPEGMPFHADNGGGGDWRFLHAAVGISTKSTMMHVSLLKMILKLYSHQALERDEHGRTPLAIAASSQFLSGVRATFVISELLKIGPSAARVPDETGRFPLNAALFSGNKKWDWGVRALVAAAPEALRVRDPITHLYPFMLAGVSWTSTTCLDKSSEEGKDDGGDLTMTYELLCACPELLQQFLPTSGEDGDCATIAKPNTDTSKDKLLS